MRRIRLPNRYNDNLCYLTTKTGLYFHICDKNGKHIEGYNLFTIYNNYISFNCAVGIDIGIDSHHNDNNGRLKIVGVDEI